MMKNVDEIIGNFGKVEELFFEQEIENIIQLANEVCLKTYGNKVFLRGLIEFSNQCIMNCLYCGIRRENKKIFRYTMANDEIFEIVKIGYEKGIRTFVLQSGENNTGLSHRNLCELTYKIKKHFQDAAITLSCGYFNKNQLKSLKDTGADRYLIRFEVADDRIYDYIKNGEKLAKRVQMLYNLKELGFETGSGFMVGLPNETDAVLLKNLKLCKELELDMVGIGPFIPHPDTPLKNAILQPLERTLKMVALLRILLPYSNIPATTAAGSIDPRGREKMLLSGANVLMPNITPVRYKQNYILYPNKICVNESNFSCFSCMEKRVFSINKKISFETGTSKNFIRRIIK